jgi:hypothetical protein
VGFERQNTWLHFAGKEMYGWMNGNEHGYDVMRNEGLGKGYTHLLHIHMSEWPSQGTENGRYTYLLA